jgi:hypothetical protein
MSRRNDVRRTVFVALAAAGALLATAAPAGAARFAVSVNAHQRTVWTQHTPLAACAAGSDGAGTERVTIGSRRPDTLSVSANPLDPVGGVIQTRLAVTRHGGLSTTAPPDTANCPIAGGDGDPAPLTDCGSRDVRPYALSLVFTDARHVTLAVTAPFTTRTYRSCYLAGTGFPQLLRAVAVLPRAELLALRPHGKEIVLGHSRARTTAGGATSTTTVRWAITLRRLAR